MTDSNKNIPEEIRPDCAKAVFDMEDPQTKYLKNIAYGKPLELAALIDYAQGQVASKTLVQNPHVGMTIFAMAAGEGISAHKSKGDAFVTVLEGKCRITIDDKRHELEKGQCIVMPAGHPHAVEAIGDFKMLLVVVFPSGD